MSNYTVKVQAVRSKGVTERPFVMIPIPIAKAMGIKKGELVGWEIVGRSQLLLVREPQASPIKKSKRR